MWPLLYSALLQMYPTTPVNWSETLLSSMCIPNMMANKVIFVTLVTLVALCKLVCDSPLLHVHPQHDGQQGKICSPGIRKDHIVYFRPSSHYLSPKKKKCKLIWLYTILYLALKRKFQNISHISTLLYHVITRKCQYISFSTFLYLPLN